jgi:hypothetical protein
MMPHLSPPRTEPRGDTLRPALIVAALGLALGGATGFGLGWWLDGLTPDGAAPPVWEHLRFAGASGLAWGLAVGGAAAATAYKAAVLDGTLPRRSWSPRPLPPLSYAEHFRPVPAPPDHAVRVPERITETAR